MSRDAIIAQLAILTRDLRSDVMRNPGCLSAAEEFDVLKMRRDLECVAREGGEITAFIEGADHVEAA